MNAIKALGRSDLFLILEVVKKILGMILILGSMRFGVLVMAYTYLLQSFLAQVINAWPNHKLLNYNYLEQLRDIFPYLLLSVLMGGAVYAVSFLALPDWQILGIQTILGAIIYWAGLALLKLECYGYIQDILRQFRRRREADSVA